MTSTYTFDNSSSHAQAQLPLLASTLDPDSLEILGDLPVQEGWRCLDVGAGAGTIAGWLANRVGPSGRVVALDIDPSQIPESANIEIHAADVREAELADDHFDLIHARLVLGHLPTAAEVLERLAGALRPGGWLVLSEWDTQHLGDMLVHPGGGQAADACRDFLATMCAVIDANGADPAWCRRVPLVMTNAGLTDVRSVVGTRLWHGGEHACQLMISNSHQLEGVLLGAGMSHEQLWSLRETMADPDTMMYMFPLVTTMGRRPGPPLGGRDR